MTFHTAIALRGFKEMLPHHTFRPGGGNRMLPTLDFPGLCPDLVNSPLISTPESAL